MDSDVETGERANGRSSKRIEVDALATPLT
jgi:hypothetical protein